jgi:hypothetical protein
MICTITESSRSARKLDVHFYGNKEDLIQCIFALIKVYFENFQRSEEEC